MKEESELFVKDYMAAKKPKLDNTVKNILESFIDFALDRGIIKFCNKEKTISAFLKKEVVFFLFMQYPLDDALKDFYCFLKEHNDYE
ncbi:MAG: hypothetical protein ACP5SB_06695 [Caldisericaceae bacterium]